MDKKEEFKTFARLHPELVSYVKSGEMSWQKFYELYDIYGEDETVWKDYAKKEEASNITNLVKNMDMDKVQEHINTAQKALGFISELTKKDPVTNTIANVTPRPITNFFKD